MEQQSSQINNDSFNNWSDKSKDIPFKSTKKCIGNGEEKLAKELNLLSCFGGQNSTIDLIHPVLGNISVKDMTKDDCTLGTDGCHNMRTLFRMTIVLLITWIEKYRTTCELANKFYNDVNKKHGSSRTTIIEGVDRFELSMSNLSKLNELLNELKKTKLEKEYHSLNSEYIDDIINSLGSNSLQELLNNCVRKEAISKTLIIVDEKKGWFIVKNISKLSCPRITRGAPRITYNWLSK
jgi:hypothetical protein